MTETQTAPMVQAKPVRELHFTYRNWRGEVAERRVSGGSAFMVFASSEWHPEPQWLMTAYDLDKDGFRDFAWKDILHPAPATLADETLRAENEKLFAECEEMERECDRIGIERNEQRLRAEAAEAKLAALATASAVPDGRTEEVERLRDLVVDFIAMSDDDWSNKRELHRMRKLANRGRALLFPEDVRAALSERRT